MKLKTRLILIVGVLLTVVLGSLSTAFYFSVRDTVAKSIDTSLESLSEVLVELRSVRESRKRSEMAKAIQTEVADLNFQLIGRIIQIVEMDGKVLYRSRHSKSVQIPLTDTAKQNVQAGKVHLETVQMDGGLSLRILSRMVPSKDQGAKVVLQIAWPWTLHQAVAEKAKRYWWGILLVSLFIGLILAYLMATMILKPVENMVAAANSIAADSLNARLPVTGGKDEFSRLAKTLNAMLERIELGFQRLSRFSSEVSHEIQNPLMALRSETYEILRQKQDDANLKDRLRGQLADIDRVSSVVAQLSLLAVSNQDRFQETFEEFSLDEIFELLEAEISEAKEEKGIGFSIVGQKMVRYRGNKTLIFRMLANLLRNAVAFCKEGSIVRIDCEVDVDRVRISVKNTGSTISSNEMERIFEPFYSQRRETQGKGMGLGLTIAQSIAHAHKGSISVHNTSEPGVCFVVELPRIRFTLQRNN